MERARAGAVLAVAAGLFLAALPWPGIGPPQPPDPVPPGAPGLLFGRRLDPNRAAPEALEVLPGIGRSRARAIARARARRPFCRVEELSRVYGIGDVTVARLRPWVRVVPPAACRSRRGGPN